MSADSLIVVGPNDDEVAAGNPGGTRHVTVAAPFQVVHDGVVYRPGDVPEVPEALADEWIRSQWVTT